MRLYIDKENITSLMKGRSENTFLYNELLRYIKNGIEVQYNFEKKDEGDVFINTWISAAYSDGVKNKPIYCPPEDVFPTRPFTSLKRFTGDDLCSIYLLNFEKEDQARNIQKKQSILVGKIGEEYDVLNKLQTLENKEVFAKDIASWKSYLPDFPLTDVVLCDPHYFDSEDIYNQDGNKILYSLCHEGQEQINIVIITKSQYIDKNKKLLDFEEECKNIKSKIQKKYSINNCKVTIVKINGNYTFHSRHLITNYYRVIHTSCFHLNNNLKDDVNTDIAPCTKSISNTITKGLLETFNNMIARVKEPKKYKHVPEIYGDKKSNLLIFL